MIINYLNKILDSPLKKSLGQLNNYFTEEHIQRTKVSEEDFWDSYEIKYFINNVQITIFVHEDDYFGLYITNTKDEIFFDDIQLFKQFLIKFEKLLI